MDVLKINSAVSCSLQNVVQFPASLMLVSLTARRGLGRVADTDLLIHRKKETELIYESDYILSRKQKNVRARTSAAPAYDRLQASAACDASRR